MIPLVHLRYRCDGDVTVRYELRSMGYIGLISFDMSLIAKFVGETPSVFTTDLLRQRRSCCVEAAIYGHIGLVSIA